MLEQFGGLATPRTWNVRPTPQWPTGARAHDRRRAAALDRATGPPGSGGVPRRPATASRGRLCRGWRAVGAVDDRPSAGARHPSWAVHRGRGARGAQRGRANHKGDLPTAAAEAQPAGAAYAARETNAARMSLPRALRYLRSSAVTECARDWMPTTPIRSTRCSSGSTCARPATRAVDRRTALAAWVQSQTDQGMEPAFAPELLNGANRQHYKNLTLDGVPRPGRCGAADRAPGAASTGCSQRATSAHSSGARRIADSITEHAGNRQANTTRRPRRSGGWRRVFAGSGPPTSRWPSGRTRWTAARRGRYGNTSFAQPTRPATVRATMRAQATSDLSSILAPVFKAGKMGGAGRFSRPSADR